MAKAKKKPCPKEVKTVVKFPMFQYSVHVIFSRDAVQARQRRDKFFGRVYDLGTATALHCVKEEDECNSYIFYPFELGMGTLVHEADHALSRLYFVNGMRPCKETSAYMMGYLCSEITKFMYKIDEKYFLDRPKKS